MKDSNLVLSNVNQKNATQIENLKNTIASLVYETFTQP